MRIAITPGEPAGIGPDLVIQLAQQAHTAMLVAIADPAMLAARAAALELPLKIHTYEQDLPSTPSAAGELFVAPCALGAPCTAGSLDPANAKYVLETLTRATDGCLTGEFAALVTAPVHKGVINDAGIAFTGHTEFLATRCKVAQPVMLLCTDTLRVALVTTHLPLTAVPAAITHARVTRVTEIVHADMQRLFGIADPKITVLGLNPHAGEGGHMGTEEQDIIEPALAALRAAGMRLTGPLPADTAFTGELPGASDVYLAMYHDQGLPVLKYSGFGDAVNVTLGLPIVRTSVDHGTALELAGTGEARVGSLRAALRLAIKMGSAGSRAA